MTTITPDNALRLQSFQQNFAETAGVLTNDLTNTFTYNPAHQVELLDQSNTLYNYTAALNRTGSYEPNGLNQYEKVDGQTLEYDATGNLIKDRAASGALTTYTYDMENHLVAVTGAASGTLRYDVLGRLSKLVTSSGTTLFHYDGDALVGEYLNGSLHRRYVHGDQVDEPLIEYQGTNLATRRYLHADHQGSIIAHSTTLGVVTQTNAYDPYGIPRPDDESLAGNQGNEGRFGYTGQAWIKELGLNYYKARIYAPRLGRFLQTDPIFYADDMNLYAYVGNDPANKIDPTGNEGAATYQDHDARAVASGEMTTEEFSERAGARAAGAAAGTAVRSGGAALVARAVVAFRAWRFERRLEKTREKLKGWEETPNKKGQGSRFQDPEDKGNRVRVDRGNPDHKQPSQRPDHVVEQKNGRTVDKDGKPIDPTPDNPKPSRTPEAHISWKDWFRM